MIPIATLAAALAPQCTDPVAPGGGFAVTGPSNQIVVFSDGATTRADVRHPSAAPGSCGWPMIVFLHGIGGSKASLAGSLQGFAQAGYFAIAFDIRGHATHTGGHTYFGQRERIDLAEVIAWGAASFPGLADASRVGLSGASQGGIFAWDGAAWSGAPIEPNPWTAGTYPEVDAIVAENTSPDFAANFAPQGLGVHSASGAIILGSGVRFDPAFAGQVQSALLAEDWAAWSALMTDPLRDPHARVPSIATAVMAMVAYDDFAFPAHALAEAWQTLPPGTPRKLYLGTGGHQSPSNNAENALRATWRRQWFDRFLKGVPNGIDAGSPITYAVTPSSTSEYLSATSVWAHETADAWPPEGTRGYRLYLRENAALAPFAPAASEAGETLHQTVAPGFDMGDVVNGGFGLAAVQIGISRSEVAWNSAPLASAIEIAGDALVHLSVSSPTTRWQVRASLWDVAPDSTARYVCGGSFFAFDDAPPGARAIDVRLNSNAYVFAAGHRVRAQVENLQIHQPPTGESLRFGPYVHDFDLELRHSPGELSWLELPVSACLPIVYGVAQPNSQGCTPAIATSGTPSATSAAPFTISASNVVNQKTGICFYGFAIADRPFHGGRLYVDPPLARTPVQSSGGNPPPDDCSGAFTLDFNAHVQSGADPRLVAGVRVFAQIWSRDPASASTTSLTDAVEFSLCD